MSISGDQHDLYLAKDVAYYGNPRADYIDILPTNRNLKIIEIGCGNGATGVAALRSGKCSEYVGIEMFASEGRKAKEVLTAVHVGNVETMILPYPPNYFDVLIASEVLEHLVDPYSTLARLIMLIKPGGRILASSPNISWVGNITGLIKGRFDYVDEGMMDRTHLRWFTPATYAEMFSDAGIRTDRLAPLAKVAGKNATRKRLISLVFGDRFDHIWWYQINFYGTRLDPAER